MPALTPRVPEDAARPLAAFVELLSPGFTLYTRHCAGCHGDDGLGEHVPVIGTDMTVKFDRDYFADVDAEDLANGVWHMVQDQKPSMPHYRWTMGESDARAIIEYLKQPNPSGGDPASVGGDESRKPGR
jgi:mono/diheme cytochrome c family protein